MTASTLYEAVEPQIIWKHLMSAVFAEIQGETGVEVCESVNLAACTWDSRMSTQAIQMALFILKTFVQDEEIQTIHLPIIFAGIVDLLDVSCSSIPL